MLEAPPAYTIEKHFVTFLSPGTFMAENTTKPIDSWDVPAAQAMADTITERYNAVPYAFYFTTRTRGPDDFDSKETARSPTYFIHCKVETLEEVELRNDPNESILRSNMRGNGFNRIVVTTRGWKWTQPLRDGDIVLGSAASGTSNPGEVGKCGCGASYYRREQIGQPCEVQYCRGTIKPSGETGND